MDDRQIVELYWARSEAAISETDKKYGRYCHYIAYQILSNDEDAKEIVNDTYLKIWNTVPPQRPDPLKPYVGTISRQLALNAYKARTRKSAADKLRRSLRNCRNASRPPTTARISKTALLFPTY